MARHDWQVDIGIECHVQLKTASKLFCGCSNDARLAEPNTLVCPVCLGLPGTLPVLNRRAVELAIIAGQALNAEIATETKFDRKNYFYPDLPKGYQITQFDQPIIGRGEIEVSDSDRSSFTVGLTRAHLEEDAGKLAHPEGADYSLVDLNRAGTPLLEIVSEPDIHSPAQAKAYAQELYLRMLYAGVSDVDLYHGNMRFDVNVSVRKTGTTTLGTRSETKNLNSFRSIERACEYEIKRQTELLEQGGSVVQETRGFDETSGTTISQRSKEEAMDYRYFPEPDLPPLVITPVMKQEIIDTAPPLLGTIRQQLAKLGVSASVVNGLLNYPTLVTKLFVERDEAQAASEHLARIANWLANVVIAELGEQPGEFIAEPTNYFMYPGELTKLSEMVESGQISSTGARRLLADYYTDFKDLTQKAEELGLLQVSDSAELEKIVDAVIADNPQAAADVESGEEKAIGFLVGQIMQASRGQANPQKVQQIIRERLGRA
ncbi:MAG: Asp-tRNA(Asn)/Glu-tRNA(Gln) amidotransferase subunit GatB [Candidatus Saccharimonadales bacterium]